MCASQRLNQRYHHRSAAQTIPQRLSLLSNYIQSLRPCHRYSDTAVRLFPERGADHRLGRCVADRTDPVRDYQSRFFCNRPSTVRFIPVYRHSPTQRRKYVQRAYRRLHPGHRRRIVRCQTSMVQRRNPDCLGPPLGSGCHFDQPGYLRVSCDRRHVRGKKAEDTVRSTILRLSTAGVHAFSVQVGTEAFQLNDEIKNNVFLMDYAWLRNIITDANRICAFGSLILWKAHSSCGHIFFKIRYNYRYLDNNAIFGFL